MDEKIATHEEEGRHPMGVLGKTADALPGLAIDCRCASRNIPRHASLLRHTITAAATERKNT
jgi:hypothetical protein